MAPSTPSSADFEAIFRATTSPLPVLDTGLTVMEVNRACEEATFRERDEVVGRHVFDAYPANPDDPPDSGGMHDLDALFRRVLATGKAQALPVLKYDVPFPGSPTGFREKYWSPVSRPRTTSDATGSWRRRRPSSGGPCAAARRSTRPSA
ncbi:PAS domain-containing protein [Streptomyces sp. CNQ085]|uniref:PAS domain-containing protein n=1 Tax=Streptomyces sp. CNQ085 TaxID=2886944 RepID=UPI001F51302A|nr:PAS domain-containing protein [Streptomyces sp. CNQ085]MCI0383656.1 PAS domain-containing protein [Streptomyces sp. CNQ085]